MAYCVVPQCKSTRKTTPNKHFFSFPNDKRRNLWMKAIRRAPSDLSPKTVLYICEDHFDLENDLENYVRFKLHPSKRASFKSGVVPHKFDCQPDRHLAHTPKERLFAKKRARESELKSVLTNTSEHEENVPPVQDLQQSDLTFISYLENEAIEALQLLSQQPPKMVDKIIQCKRRPETRSKFVQCQLEVPQKDSSRTNNDSEGENLSESSDDFIDIVSSSSGSWYARFAHEESLKSYPSTYQSVKSCFTLYLNKPKNYLGISQDCMGILQIIKNLLKITDKELLIVLLKIRKSYTLDDIADRLNISQSHCSRLFAKNLCRISVVLEKFIFWPSKEIIYQNLPITFRSNYSKVQSIIDCFEIEIEQPSNPVLQTLTWFQYKHCNTMKYLISSTPNGFINFISKGYGGRTTDQEIVKLSNFLRVVPQGAWIMADRGFKGIASLLEARGCRLVRPPSVHAGEKLSRDDVLSSKRISSLRIHIERVIRRLREYNLLKPHSVVNNKIIKYLDDIVLPIGFNIFVEVDLLNAANMYVIFIEAQLCNRKTCFAQKQL